MNKKKFNLQIILTIEGQSPIPDDLKRSILEFMETFIPMIENLANSNEKIEIDKKVLDKE